MDFHALIFNYFNSFCSAFFYHAQLECSEKVAGLIPSLQLSKCTAQNTEQQNVGSRWAEYLACRSPPWHYKLNLFAMTEVNKRQDCSLKSFKPALDSAAYFLLLHHTLTPSLSICLKCFLDTCSHFSCLFLWNWILTSYFGSFWWS